ncbi:MAG TPA: hypothetical protein PLN42_06595 [Anaerolineae bacterium]|nr:hypothetical protein [Anaerolineae bacterium]
MKYVRKKDRPKPQPTQEMLRQIRLSAYGHGPFDEDMGQPCGYQDVATIQMIEGFCVVRTEYLDALIALTKSQEERLAQLEKKA